MKKMPHTWKGEAKFETSPFILHQGSKRPTLTVFFTRESSEKISSNEERFFFKLEEN